ncbi:hypothetical protein C8A00DRAFT_15308 [Chaetomidium leptoderma]|uniref:Uncharacterized protein n=1 Tax=Chaetomidium leptoderma TaxID=669021 RepID=A0AAN6VMF9_9PEZI|nr:hypothetical protein C8A00DRAFT_15308 [Chaetomidium leptoderma]
MSVDGGDLNLPPASSQSHFANFQNFTPNDDASFDNEFARLASSQNWVPGSQEYTQERTIAMREELKLHYFAPSDDQKEPTEDDQLQGYQSLCQEVGISPPSHSIAECKRELKKTLVNIVDLIDARRTHKEVKVWDDFEAFRDYTLEDDHIINMKEAKKDGGFLASLLQRLRTRSGERRNRRRGSRVVSGRVIKKSRG